MAAGRSDADGTAGEAGEASGQGQPFRNNIAMTAAPSAKPLSRPVKLGLCFLVSALLWVPFLVYMEQEFAISSDSSFLELSQQESARPSFDTERNCEGWLRLLFRTGGCTSGAFGTAPGHAHFEHDDVPLIPPTQSDRKESVEPDSDTAHTIQPFSPDDSRATDTEPSESKPTDILPRWRGNNYVNEAGILPWQRCGAGDFAPGPPMTVTRFSFLREDFQMIVMAASFWGETDATGKPLQVNEVQLLLFWKSAQRMCEYRSSAFHCTVPSGIFPPLQCRLDDDPPGQWRSASRRFNETRVDVTVDFISCPLGVQELKDRFVLEVRMGDDSGAPLTAVPLDICYQHVEEATNVTICTQPGYGYSEKSSFWNSNHPPTDHSLIDSFILYHTRIMGIKKIMMYDGGHSLEPGLKNFWNKTEVGYRPGWQWLDFQTQMQQGLEMQPYMFQTQAEITCMWEQRITSHWIMLVHSIDCYVITFSHAWKLPDGVTGLDVPETIARANYSRLFSEVQAPTMLAKASSEAVSQNASLNLPQRFPLLGSIVWAGRWAPLGNPRDFDANIVHYFVAPRNKTYKGTLISHKFMNPETLPRVAVVHVMDMIQRTQKDIKWNNPKKIAENPWWTELGQRLAAEIKKFNQELVLSEGSVQGASLVETLVPLQVPLNRSR